LNKGQFTITADKTITMKKQGKIEFLSTTESFKWFIDNRCDGNIKNSEIVYTQKVIAKLVSSPISWSKGDFGFAALVSMDGDQDGRGTKNKVTQEFGPVYGKRVECLGRAGGGGSNNDKWIYGIILNETEISERKLGNKKLYYDPWVEEEANTDSVATWTWPCGLEKKPAVAVEEEKQTPKTRKVKEKETPPPVDIPGQQSLPGTDPKPVETAPPVSIIKPPAIITPPPPLPPTSESLKQDIKIKAIGDAVSAGTIPPAPPAIGGTPPAVVVSTPPQTVYMPKETVIQTEAPKQETPSVQGMSTQAVSLLDTLLSNTNQK
jgi:hypothetical protein